MRIHLSIVQPQGYLHSQGFLDQARYARYQFRRLGAEVTIGKNRLREDSVNVILGAHLGFDPSLKDRFTCVFFNLEQLCDGGAKVSQDYINLLRTSAVIDYEARNLGTFGCSIGDVPLISFGFAPYLATDSCIPISERPIDILFFGGVNERRRALFSRIEACGWNISMFDHPLYGDERDHFIRQAKVVLNCHFYESGCFEQARAFHTLSLRTPVVSERTSRTNPPKAFEDAVTWLDDNQFESFFKEEFLTDTWVKKAENQLQAFQAADPMHQWRVALAYCTALSGGSAQNEPEKIWRPKAMNLGAGDDYKIGWVNVDKVEKFQPDICIDLETSLNLPLQFSTSGGGMALLEEGALELIQGHRMLDHVQDPQTLMTNLLALLKEEGVLELETPYSRADIEKLSRPDIRTVNYNSWVYYIINFLRLGWVNHRFEVDHLELLDDRGLACVEDHATLLRVRLKKVSTTFLERSLARTKLSDFGVVDTDAVFVDQSNRRSFDELIVKTNRIVSVTDLGFNNEAAIGEDYDWLALLPQVTYVLGLGKEAHRLKRAYLRKFPQAVWTSYEDGPLTVKDRTVGFELMILGSDAAVSPDLPRILSEASGLLHSESSICVALSNASSQQTVDALFEGDSTHPHSKGTILESRGTTAHLFKVLLDAGWSPSVEAHRASADLGSEPRPAGPVARTRDLVSMMDRVYVRACRSPDVVARTPGDALFTVVVPCNREDQLAANVKASAGLKEVRARLVSIQGASSPGEALAEGMRHVCTEWILLAHQDVYFPSGFGERLNTVLSAIPAHERPTALIGFAGIARSQTDLSTSPAGYLTDRLFRFDHGPSSCAVSLDEFAVVLHKDSVHRIDPALGWHLWATDLCLSSLHLWGRYASIICLPVFHNSRTGWKLPDDFIESTEALLHKHNYMDSIHTLCGVLSLNLSDNTENV
jgi:hypothetical protein